MGSVTSASVGSLHAARENVSGQYFHEWLQRHKMWLPSTFEQCHQGDGNTWAHPTGAMARLDYVAIPMAVGPHGVKSWIPDTIDISVHRIDHLPVCVDVTLIAQSESMPSEERSCEQPEGPSNLQFPEVKWDMDIHHHADQLETALRNYQRQSKRRAAIPRKTHLREPTWNLILAKKTCWRQLRELGKHYRAGVVREIFNRWRDVKASPHEGQTDNFRPWLRWVDRAVATRWALHRQLAAKSSHAVRQDDAEYYHALAERAGKIDEEKGLQGLWKEIKAVLPRQQSKRKSNTRCRQPPPESLVRHFTTLEAGESIPFSSLAERCNSDQQERATVVMSVDDPATLPDRLSIERLCMKVQSNKAPGLDRISPHIVKEHAGLVAKALNDLFLKMWILRAEPIMWKGGQLFPLWKGSGSWGDPTKYRGIVLLSVLGKRWHALLRKRILPFAEAHRLPTQFGGFPMQQPGFATSMVRTFANICKAHNLCDACIYFDLRSAFHHLLRQFAMDLPDSTFPAPLQQVLAQDGFSFRDLGNRADERDQLGKLPLPSHLNQLLSDLHQFTWFSIRGDGEPVWTHRGTRPGSPYADLGFNAFMGQLMIGIREQLHHHRSFEEACNISGLDPVVVGWVDDIAIPLAAVSPPELCDLIKTVTEQVLLTMYNAGLQINMDRGKTECIATFRGRGAPSMRKTVFIDDKGTLPVVINKSNGESVGYDLHLVGKYVHLGTCMAQEQNFDLEIKRRIGIAQSAFRSQPFAYLFDQSSEIDEFHVPRAFSCWKVWFAPNSSTTLDRGHSWGRGECANLSTSWSAGNGKSLVQDSGRRTVLQTPTYNANGYFPQ